ncbi:MAG: hypothetical protein ABSF63_08005 [Candidatus Bathyarchaeia archaeon]
MNIRNGHSRLDGHVGFADVLNGPVVSIEVPRNQPQLQVDI